jgi:hypothetical protein
MSAPSAGQERGGELFLLVYRMMHDPAQLFHSFDPTSFPQR